MKSKKPFKIHFLREMADSTSACNVRFAAENWHHKDYCTSDREKVTCGTCKNILKQEARLVIWNTVEESLIQVESLENKG